MQIAFCIFKSFPHGGIPRDLMKIARVCRGRGHRVRIYAARWESEQPEDMELVMVPVRSFTNHERYERFAVWVRAHLRDHPADLVVGMNKMPGLDVYYAGDSCYEEKVSTQRNGFYRLLPRYRHFSRFERAVFDPGVPTRILTISETQVPDFRRHYGTPPERFHALPPGIDRDRRAPDGTSVAGPEAADARTAFRAEQGVADDEQIVLFLGSGFIKKGLDRALLALQALPLARQRKTWLFVVGHDNAEPFRRMAKRLGVYRRVRFFGGRDDVPRFLAAADAMVLPAYDENAGMVILESMIAGLPALVTANCGYARYLRDAGAGLIAELPFDQQAFNAQLLELLTSPERPRWRANGLALAADENIYRLAEVAADHLERCAAERRPIIAFVLFKYFPYGGLQRDFLRVARACQARGYAVRVYTLGWQGEITEGFDVVEAPVTGVMNFSRYRRFARWVQRDLRWRPVACVVGFNKLPGLDVYYAADTCFEEKAREQRGFGYRYTRRYRHFSRFERAVFAPDAQTRVLLITARQKDSFQRFYGTPDERFTLLPPGVARDRQRGDDAAAVRAGLRCEFGIGEDDLLLLLVGSGFITKGLDRALTAVAALPPALRRRVRFFVVGQDSPRRFVDMAQSLGIGDQIVFLSGRDDVPRFLQGADLMLHPAYMESGGIVLLEAAIAGLPVVTTAACGFAPYIEEARAGVVIGAPFDQERLNAALRGALEDPEQRRAWSEAGVAFGRSADIYGMAERAAAIIEECARARSVSA
jgi:UDP-glucose:(heptosyl)LPS alpha-1,3-glucosyltransferase